MPSRKVVRPDDKRILKRGTTRPKTRMQQLIDGDIGVEDLEDEEVAMGRVKDSGGKFRGRPPKSFPRELHDALRREFQTRMNEKFQATVDSAHAVLLEVASNRRNPAVARVRASEVLLERGLGKVSDRVVQTLEIKKYEEDVSGLLVDIQVEENK